MNEVTNIHLGRETFTISVDAYGTLQTYLHDIKKQLGDDGEAVAEEVELRMAELLTERGITGKKVILPKDVAYLKQQLGSPQDFKDDENNTEPSDTENSAPKGLYRNTSRGIIAGVAAGMAEYTGAPTFVYRLIFILLTLVHGLGIIVYLFLWGLIPEAKTPSNVLKMQGKPVTVHGIKGIIQRADVPGTTQRLSRTLQYYMSKFLRLVTFLVGIGLILLAIGGFAAVVTTGAYVLAHGVRVADTLMFPIGAKQVVAVVCGFVVAALLAATLSIIGKAMIARKWSLPGWVLAAIIGVFVTAASAGTALGIDAVPTVQNRLKSIEHSSVMSLAPFNSVALKGSSVQYQIKYDPSYYMEIHTVGHIDTRPIKATTADGQLTIDTTGLTVPSTDCSRGNSVFDLCPYGSSGVEIIVRGPIGPDMPINTPDVPVYKIFKPAPYL